MTSSDSNLDLIYQDDYLLVSNKPAGLLAVPGRGADKQDATAQAASASACEARTDLSSCDDLFEALFHPRPVRGAA